MKHGWHRPAVVAGLVLALVGCHARRGLHVADVSRDVEARFGQPIGGPPGLGHAVVPEGLAAGRPLAEDQAVLLALWNNAAFHDALKEVDLTRADLVTAGLLPNPEFFYSWPVDSRNFRYLFDFPIESLFFRPFRVKSAAAENERAAGRVAQLALDLIRDTRQAFADLRLAQDRVKVFDRAVELRGRVLTLTEARLEAGEVGELVAATARVDALLAAQDRTRAGYDVTVAAERVRNLTGLSGFNFPITADDAPFDPRADRPVDDLVAEAVATRPDVRAAEAAARAAGTRATFATFSFVRLLGILDATSGRRTGHEFGPAFRVTLPIFNQAQGLTARAKAERDQLELRRLVVYNQVVLDVRTAFARFEQTRAELDLLRAKTRPEVEAAIRRAEAAYKEGDATYLIVLESNRQLIDTYSREAALTADLRRFWAELERGVGRRLLPPAPPAEPPGPAAGPTVLPPPTRVP